MYRKAGKGGFKNAKAIRRFGCPFLLMLTYCLIAGFKIKFWYLYLIAYGLNVWGMSTYWDFLAPDGNSENWLCWLVTGGFSAAAILPMLWTGMPFWGYLQRIIVCALVSMAWSEFFSWDEIEERGRGWVYYLTLFFII